MEREECLTCGSPIRMMCAQGTGFCSENCYDQYRERPPVARLVIL